jgi:bla regulator protein blaR1
VSFFLMSKLGAGIYFSRKLIRAGAPVEDGVLESNLVRIPVTVGVLGPVILLPAGWREWDEQTLRSVHAHEQAHIRRGDPLRLFAASVYRSLCWFHPLAWWLRAQLAELAEAASDDAALDATGGRLQYAEALLSFLAAAPRRVEWEGVAMATRGARRRRIERILDTSRSLSRPIAPRAFLALMAIAAPLVLLAASARPVRSSKPAAVPMPAFAMQASTSVCGGSGPYLQWMQEDAAYIITGEERKIYESLTTKEQCEAFIGQFWLRREPDFKQEHYRRIAYANERFGAPVPGWKTDRGRTYIIFGPANEIESHPSSRGGSIPYEIWRYPRIDGLGDRIEFAFTDPNLNGEYRLESTRRGYPVPGADAASEPIVFGSPGSVAVLVWADRTIGIVLAPVELQGDVNIYGRITGPSGKVVAVFEQATLRQSFRKVYVTPQAPGAYSLTLVQKNSSGASLSRMVAFEVK